MRYPPHQVGEEVTLLYPDQREVERLENCSGMPCSRLTEDPSESEPVIVYRQNGPVCSLLFVYYHRRGTAAT